MNFSTPNDIEVLIHCHCCQFKHPRIDAPAVFETIMRFLDDGIIEFTGEEGIYTTTEKGRAWLMCILRVEYPKHVYIDHSGSIIEPY